MKTFLLLPVPEIVLFPFSDLRLCVFLVLLLFHICTFLFHVQSCISFKGLTQAHPRHAYPSIPREEHHAPVRESCGLLVQVLVEGATRLLLLYASLHALGSFLSPHINSKR